MEGATIVCSNLKDRIASSCFQGGSPDSAVDVDLRITECSVLVAITLRDPYTLS